MKVTIEVECTPDEARSLIGLPDIAGMQNAMVEKIQEKLIATVENADAESLMKFWLPTALGGVEKLQKLFLGPILAAAERATGSK